MCIQDSGYWGAPHVVRFCPFSWVLLALDTASGSSPVAPTRIKGRTTARRQPAAEPEVGGKGESAEGLVAWPATRVSEHGGATQKYFD